MSATIQPAIDAENAALLNDPNFHAIISAAPTVSFSFMGQTTNFYQPNQYFAGVPYSIIYSVTNISVQGWFTGHGALDFFAGFTHLHFGLPAMTEGQTLLPTSGNVATTTVPIESQ